MSQHLVFLLSNAVYISLHAIRLSQMKPITKREKIIFIYCIYWMCLLLNYALANLHVATEKAVGECGERINHQSHSSVGQSRI